MTRIAARGHTAAERDLLAGHAAQDEMGEWGLEYARARALGLVDNNLYALAQEEKRRTETLADCARRWLGELPGCKGDSCRQGRGDCTQRCHEVDTAAMPADEPAVVELGPIREMACYEPADEQPQGWLMRVIRWLKG